MRSIPNLIVFAFLLSLLACASPIPETTDELLTRPVSCDSAAEHIAALEAAKPSAGEQATAAATSVVPAAAVVGVVSGTAGDKARVATGGLARDIDAKIAKIRVDCGLDPPAEG